MDFYEYRKIRLVYALLSLENVRVNNLDDWLESIDILEASIYNRLKIQHPKALEPWVRAETYREMKNRLLNLQVFTVL